MPDSRTVTVFGADGLVGGIISSYVTGHRIVWRSPASPDEVHIAEAAPVLAASDVVFHAAGPRVTPGLGWDEYRRGHEEVTRTLVSKLSSGSCLVLISSISVMGQRNTVTVTASMPPLPESFPCADYARAKLVTEQAAAEDCARRGVRLVILRPANVYVRGGESWLNNLVRLAGRGVLLRLLPSALIQQSCSGQLLGATVRAVVERLDRELLREPLLVVDPFYLTNRQIERAIEIEASVVARRLVSIPVPVVAIGHLLSLAPRAKIARLDFRTLGEVFRILANNTRYDASATYQQLGLNPDEFSKRRIFDTFVHEEFLDAN